MKLTELPLSFQDFPYATEALESFFFTCTEIREKDRFPTYIGFTYNKKVKDVNNDEELFFFAYDEEELTSCVSDGLDRLSTDEELRVFDVKQNITFRATLKAKLTQL